MRSRSSWLGTIFIILTRLSARMQPILWGWLYNQMASKDRNGELLFMNYGYIDEGKNPLKLRPEDEAFRYPIQLYAHMVDGIDLRGKDVVEVGCGRGGGGAFLIRYHAPSSFIGVDLSKSAIQWCRLRMKFLNACWLQGYADSLPVPNESVDIVINVESSHCYPSMTAFLGEVKRVLRPGGYFAFCDIRSTEGVEKLDRSFKESGLEMLERQVITPQVLRALDSISPQRERQIASYVPRLFRSAFRNFLGVKNTVQYDMLVAGKMAYLSYLLKS